MSPSAVTEDFSLIVCGRTGDDRTLCLPGDVLVGRLNLRILQHIALTSITITVRGRGFVHWTNQQIRGPGEPRFKDTQHHSSSEDYLERTLVLYGQVDQNQPEKCYLPAGRYSYPFRCELPSRLPCSYEGEYGYVRYWVKASIEKGRQILHKTKVPFSLLSPLDLNIIPESNKPVQESTAKNMCCFCCLSGPISATLCLPKRGYVPGEPIRFGAEVVNMSRRKMGCVSVELKMTTVYKTDTDYRSTTQQICKVKRDQKIARGEEITWYCDQLVVPPIPPSCLIGCNIISIKYTLELRVDPIGPAFDLTLPIEVIIGTVPHRIHRPEQHYANLPRDQSGNRATNGNSNTGTAPHRVGSPINHHYESPQVNPVEPIYSYACADRNSERDQNRPPSRSSSAPSTASTTSTVYSKRSTISVMFAEASTRRRKFRFDDDSDKSNGSLKFTPVYPFYQWR